MATSKKTYSWEDLVEELPEPLVLEQTCDAPVRPVELLYGQVYKCVDPTGTEHVIGIPDFRAEEASEWDSNEYHLWKREGKAFVWMKGYKLR